MFTMAQTRTANRFADGLWYMLRDLGVPKDTIVQKLPVWKQWIIPYTTDAQAFDRYGRTWLIDCPNAVACTIGGIWPGEEDPVKELTFDQWELLLADVDGMCSPADCVVHLDYDDTRPFARHDDNPTWPLHWSVYATPFMFRCFSL